MEGARPLAVVVRMSAIGDVILACRTAADLVRAGCDVLFVTSPGLQSVVEMLVPQVAGLALAERGLGLRFFRRQNPAGPMVQVNADDFRAWMSERISGGAWGVLDLQGTARSRRARGELRAQLGVWPRVCVKVRKRSIARIAGVLRARLALRQTPRKSYRLDSVRAADFPDVPSLQRRALESLLARLGMPQVRLPPLDAVWAKAPECADLMSDLSLLVMKYVVVFPGASLPLKAWPRENQQALLGELVARTDLTVVLAGGPQEADFGVELEARWPGRVRNLAGKTSLSDSLRLVAKAHSVVCGDSFPAHAAAAFGTRASVLFGATSPDFGFCPRAPWIAVRYLALSCSPCTRHGRGKCRFGNLACMRGHEAGAVVSDILSCERTNSGESCSRKERFREHSGA